MIDNPIFLNITTASMICYLSCVESTMPMQGSTGLLRASPARSPRAARVKKKTKPHRVEHSLDTDVDFFTPCRCCSAVVQSKPKDTTNAGVLGTFASPVVGAGAGGEAGWLEEGKSPGRR